MSRRIRLNRMPHDDARAPLFFPDHYSELAKAGPRKNLDCLVSKADSAEPMAFRAFRFTTEQILDLERHGITIFQSDEEAFARQARWLTPEKRTVFLEGLRRAIQQGDPPYGLDSDWEFDSVEAMDHAIARLLKIHRLKICPVCHFPLVLKNSADKLHDECKIPRRRARQLRYVQHKRKKLNLPDTLICM